MADNLELYNNVRSVPKEAQKPIQAGRLKGMTDINPMWRIKVLTEQFGACGKGWYFDITETKVEYITDSEELVATVVGNLYVKYGDEWSKPIFGIGGAKMASKERAGLYVDDECYKKASTDALSVACKNLGIGADVYWDKDTDKYIDSKKDNFNSEKPSTRKPASTSDSKASTESVDESTKKERAEIREKIIKYGKEHNITDREIANDYGINKESTVEELKAAYQKLTTPPDVQEDLAAEFAALDEPLPF